MTFRGLNTSRSTRGLRDQDTFIVIGIDFGTTYSGVAWAWSGTPDDVNIVTDWKSALAQHSDNAKAPTEILYNHRNSHASDARSSSEAGTSSTDAEPLWGYGIPPGREGLKWFKLLLVDEGDLEPEVRNSRQVANARLALAATRKTAVQIVADYLRLLWRHAVQTIKQSLGKTLVDGLPFRVVLTVPAIWKQTAIDRTVEAARCAGITKERPCGATTLLTVAEPEAAALATLSDLGNRPDVVEGDVFVVCDAGGGTADLISYVIRSTDPMAVAEYVGGVGRLCGGIFVDQAFIAHMKALLGKKWERLSEEGIKRLLSTEWENGVKQDFDGRDKTWSVSIPAEAYSGKMGMHGLNDNKRGIHSGNASLTKSTVEAFFQGPIGQIRGLISDQINAVKAKSGRNPKGVLLVGGFGSCKYLYKKLSQQYGKSGIEIHQTRGQKPWTAICRGALVKGLSMANVQSERHVQVVSRVSRLNYGISYYTRFVEGKHNELDKKWDRRECKWTAIGQMHWYLRKGVDVVESAPTPPHFRYYALLSEPLPGNILELEILQSEEDSAGPRGNVKEVTPLCSLCCHLDVEFDDLPTFVNRDDEIFRKIEYEVKMTWNGAALDWVLSINGRVQGKKSVTVSFHEASKPIPGQTWDTIDSNEVDDEIRAGLYSLTSRFKGLDAVESRRAGP